MSKDSKIFAYVALGSNADENIEISRSYIDRAISEFSNKYLEVVKISKYYQTPAFPKGNGPDFVNCVLTLKTASSAQEVLNILHSIEAKLGRIRKKRWGQRVIDIDLLDYNQKVRPDVETYQKWRDLDPKIQTEHAPNELILPHPRIQDRAFVLVPLRDVAPDWIDPYTKLSIEVIIDQLPKEELAEIWAIN